MSLTYALLQDDADGSLTALLVAGAYGATRTASLLTATIVTRNSTGMQLDGAWALLRSAYVAATDTPVAFVALCLARLWPDALAMVIIVYAALTLVQTAVSAASFFKRPTRDRVPMATEHVTP